MNAKRVKPWETASRKVAQLSEQLTFHLVRSASSLATDSARKLVETGWQERLDAACSSGQSDFVTSSTESPVARKHRLRYMSRLGWSVESRTVMVTWARDTSQTLACCLAIMASRPSLTRSPIAPWLIHQADPLWRGILQLVIGLIQGDEVIMATAKTPWHRSGTFDEAATFCPDPLLDFLREQASEAKQWFSDDPTPDDESSWFITHFFELFLATHDPAARQHRGVYYTPRSVVERMVSDVDALLQTEFGLADGLSDLSPWKAIDGKPDSKFFDSQSTPAFVESPFDATRTPFLHLLDPAAGSGAFLVEVIALIARHYHSRVASQARHAVGDESAERQRDFDGYLTERMRRLRGFEILLPACLVAQLNVAVKLEQLGFQFTCTFPPLVQLRDTLAGPQVPERDQRHSATTGVIDLETPDITEFQEDSVAGPYTVILGNPPFSGVSTNESPWIRRLLRGSEKSDPVGRSYFQIDGQPLREKKVWLNDDYVKFFRDAQWRIDRAGGGLIAFVSNHGYLDNVTFRGMRQSLLDSFPRITIIDLHGNRKRHEMTASGHPDFNLFAIAQGTAIGYFRAPLPGSPGATHGRFTRRDITGTEAEKRAQLQTSPVAYCTGIHQEPTASRPVAPLYSFSSTPETSHHELPAGIPLNELMPCSSSVPVTARDHLVLAFTADELERKLADFVDPKRSDDQVRREIFTRARSRRYPAGDTRGWKLREARQRMRHLADWQAYFQTCLYRPWDERVIFWAEWMVDWPRCEFMRGWCSANNWGLITRRQMLPNKPCNFIWVSNQLVLDGVLRSDNRGNEYLFPLYRVSSAMKDTGHTALVANFATEPIAKLSRRWSLNWLARGCGDLEATWGPEDLGCYLYGLLHCETYQRAFAAALGSGFPPIVFPRAKQLFRIIRTQGAKLAACHLRLGISRSDRAESSDGWTVSPRYPRYEQGKIWTGPDSSIAEVDAATWEFRAGAHQVAAKWLADRRGRLMAEGDQQNYLQVLRGITETLLLKQQLNDCLESPKRFAMDFE